MFPPLCRLAELNRACAYSLIFFVVGFPLSMVSSVYGAYQDGFMANIWNIAGSAIALISLIVVAQMKGGLPQLVLAISGTRILVGLANIYYMFFRKYPWLMPWPSEVRWTSIKRLLSLGGNYMITQLAGLGIYQSQPMIITQMLGPSYVVIFVVAQKIVTLPNDLVFMATRHSFPLTVKLKRERIGDGSNALSRTPCSPRWLSACRQPLASPW